jgi:hypothetical protein
MIANANAVLSPFALLWPTFALVLLILMVWLTLLVQRMRHIKANPPTREDFATGEAARRYFEPVETPANNLANLFEMPVLFFALVPLLLMFRQVTTTQLILAWIFVGTRALHSFVHIGPKNVRTRFQLYLLSVAMLTAMWVGFFVDAIRASWLYGIHQGLVAQL